MSTISNLIREELYELVWNTPLSKLAPKFGFSDKGLAKKKPSILTDLRCASGGKLCRRYKHKEHLFNE